MSSLPVNPAATIAVVRGSKAPLELAVFVGDSAETHALPSEGTLSIGRSSENQIVIDHPSVSRFHARLHVGPKLWLEDLGGVNGTHIHLPLKESGAGETRRSISLTTEELRIGDHINFGSVMSVVRRRSERAPTAVDREPARSRSPSREGVILSDPAMLALYAEADLAAQSLISVLLLGETGVGKEVLARTIHLHSPRAAGPFLAVNCAALPESLLEGELFGHEKDSFTGAAQARRGLFESADGGTVFLDEAGDLPMTVQVKLLRVLEERQVLRIGGRSPRPINVRFVAATNCDLATKVANGTFRKDLYYRLNGLSLTIPPLRDRVSDIAPLAELFAQKASRALDLPATASFSDEALALLQQHTWPGNIRELRNVVERAVVLGRGGTILPSHLPSPVVLRPMPYAAIDATQPMLRPTKGSVAERELIIAALAECGGNQTLAAKKLGVSRRTFISRLDEHGLDRPRK